MANEYFDVMTSIISKKKVTDEEILKHYSGFMAMTWLSAHPKAAWMVNNINSARGNKFIAKEKIAEYKTLKSIIDLPKNTRLAFDKKDKHQKVIIEAIMSHYNVGKVTANEYYNILGGHRVLALLEMYARKNEKNFAAKEMEYLTKLRAAITAKKKQLLKD